MTVFFTPEPNEIQNSFFFWSVFVDNMFPVFYYFQKQKKKNVEILFFVRPTLI